MKTQKMTRAETVELISGTLGLRSGDVEKVLTEYGRLTTLRMHEGIAVPLPGLGTLVPKPRPARAARNPRTGEEVQVPAHTGVTFKAGKALKDSLRAHA